MNSNKEAFIDRTEFLKERSDTMASLIIADMTDNKISKKALWDKEIEDLKVLHLDELADPLETYFHKTPNRISFAKKLPVNIKIKLINMFFRIYDV